MTIDPREHQHRRSTIRTDNTTSSMTNEELRRRRLVALEQQRSTTTSTLSSSSKPDPPPAVIAADTTSIAPSLLLSSSTTSPPLMVHDDNNEVQDDDEDLQAAIAMSLHSASAAASAASSTHPGQENIGDSSRSQDVATMAADNGDRSDMFLSTTSSSSSTTTGSVAEPLGMNVSVFHNIMWDTTMTTQQDKQRWLQQGIHVSFYSDKDENNNTTTTTMDIDNASAAEEAQTTTHGSTIFEMVGADYRPWGLMQMHGGPCGVLAAVQAELLKLLLFGNKEGQQQQYNPYDDDWMTTTMTTSPSIRLEYPMKLNPSSTTTSSDKEGVLLTSNVIRQAMAMSIAMIIARASVMPSAHVQDDDDDCEEEREHAVNKDSSDRLRAHIVLPSPPADGTVYSGLTWQHLYPPSPTTTTTTKTTTPSLLNVHTISVPPLATNRSKRQKTHELNSSSPPPSEDQSSPPPTPRRYHMIRLAHAIANFLLNGSQQERTLLPPLEYFQKPGGVILLAMSVVCSRGSRAIQDDMDDPVTGRLTSQFGHCSQELMNLLLTGQAVSNVFDNTLTPSGGGLTCVGIQSQPDIGYLTQLEAMRYCQVGGYYKSPRFPIWVVGSASHFSVLFGEPSCLKESKSDVLLEQCRRAFKSIQGAEENGFIPKDSLKQVLEILELDKIANDDALYPVLCAMCDVGDAGIIVWDEFWKIASRLMTGASVESVLQRQESGGEDDSMPPLLLTNGEGNEPDKKPAARRAMDDEASKIPPKVSFMEDTVPQSIDAFAVGTTQGRVDPLVESDEEMARRLAQEWGASEINSPPVAPAAAAAAAARPSSPMEMDTTMSADEELARKLQAEVWESEAGQPSGSASVDAVAGSPVPPLLQGEGIELDGAGEANAQFQDSKMPAMTRKLEFEKFGDSFRLYHYNGLRGGNLAQLRVTRLTAEEAVGASVPLTNSAGASGDKGPGATWDLEDVLRTKWPSCGIDFLGKPPPSID